MRKIQKTGKRALSIIMSIAMLVSVFPLTALAADDEYEVTIKGGANGTLCYAGTPVEGNVASVMVRAGESIPDEYEIVPKTDYSVANFAVESGFEIVQIATAANNCQATLVLGNDGKVYGTGENTYGQLGVNDTEDRYTFTQMDMSALGDAKAVAIALGSYHSMVLDENGKVYACGRNNFGQLGNGTNEDSLTLTPVTLPNGVASAKAISTRATHSVIIGDNDRVYSCGENNGGQFGNGTSGVSATFQLMNLPDGVESVKAISAGYCFTLFIGNDDRLYGCGANSYGQLGNGTFVSSITPTKADQNYNIIIKEISAGTSHAVLTDSNDRARAAGQNGFGQLINGLTENASGFSQVNLPSGVTSVKASSAGMHTTIIIGDDGNAYAGGWNNSGQLGNGTVTGSSEKLVKMILPDGVSSARAVCGGFESTLVVGDDYRLYACGRSAKGQLGNGSGEAANKQSKLTAVQGLPERDVATAASLGEIVVNKNMVVTASYTYSKTFPVTIDAGQNGVLLENGAPVTENPLSLRVPAGEKIPDRYTVTPNTDYAIQNFKVETGLEVVQMAAGATHTVLLASDGKVYSCGNNRDGQLGRSSGESNYDSVFAPMPLPDEVVKVTGLAPGYNHTIVIGEDESGVCRAYSCGANALGQLSRPVTEDAPANKLAVMVKPNGEALTGVTQAAAGRLLSIVVAGGKAYSCGYNNNGQLSRAVDELESPQDRLCGMLTADGDELTEVTYAAANYHIIVVSGGMAYSCGRGSNNVLGRAGDRTRLAPMLDETEAPLTGVTQAATGESHTIVVANGRAYSCGYAIEGALGRAYGSNVSSLSRLGVMTTSTGEALDGVTQVAAGNNHTIALIGDGAYSCGSNTLGQLGLGISDNAAYLTAMELPDSATTVTQLAAGYAYSIVVSDGDAYGCGINQYGQLNNSGDNIGTSNANLSLVVMKDGMSWDTANATYAATLGEITVDREMRITAQYVEATTFYSVDISWGSMEFTYADGTWDAQTHAWNGAGWEADAENANRVSITNNSSVPISAEVAYIQNAEFTGIEGTMTDGTSPVTAPATFTAQDATTQYFYLELTGALSERIANDVKSVGTVKISLNSEA